MHNFINSVQGKPTSHSPMKTIQIAILASGSGTNTEQIIRTFSGDDLVRITLVMTNKPDAKVIQRAANLNVPAVVAEKSFFQDGEKLTAFFKEKGIDFIVLAGFLLKIPAELIQAYPERILNIHPSLLPRFGGKGMYGLKVHEAVLTSGDATTGITIHLIDENYDEGSVLFQAECPVLENDTPELLAKRVHQLEYEHYPAVIKRYILSK